MEVQETLSQNMREGAGKGEERNRETERRRERERRHLLILGRKEYHIQEVNTSGLRTETRHVGEDRELEAKVVSNF